jgi:hypothetical protein
MASSQQVMARRVTKSRRGGGTANAPTEELDNKGRCVGRGKSGYSHRVKMRLHNRLREQTRETTSQTISRHMISFVPCVGTTQNLHITVSRI